MINQDERTMHRDNRDAKYEDAAWIEDVARWRDEHQRAAAWLEKVRAAWNDAEVALQNHAEKIRRHELQLQRHERTVRDHWPRGDRLEHEKLTSEHEALKREHARMQQQHRQLKQRHESFMVEIRELLTLALAGAVVNETFA